jgi:glycosyltransferase involved in cell wall biosynthesis
VIRRTIQSHGLQGHVHELGFIPQADLPGLYGSARAFIFASRLEGFGMPLLEAMASGAPVIVAPNPPLPEVVGKAALVTLDDSPRALAQGIVALMDDPTRAAELRCRGLGHARGFTWERAAKETVAVYQELVDEHHAIVQA